MTEPPKPAAHASAETTPATARASAVGRGSIGADGLAIGELAREFEITTRAIRFYEARGLICPQRRGAARVFGPADRHRLALIVRARSLGLSLEEIGEHLAVCDGSVGDLAEMCDLKARADRHIAALNRKRANLQETLAELKRIRAALAARIASERRHRR